MNRNDIFIMYCMAVAAFKSLIKTIIAMASLVCIAWVVAALIYGLFIYTAFAYFGEIVLWLQELIYG